MVLFHSGIHMASQKSKPRRKTTNGDKMRSSIGGIYRSRLLKIKATFIAEMELVNKGRASTEAS